MSEGFYRVENKFDDANHHVREPFVDLFVFEHDTIVRNYAKVLCVHI